MFGWLIGMKPKDPWKHSYGYVAQFREELDEVARLLSMSSRHLVWTRFNRYRACAELYTDAGDVVALVRVYGEFKPDTAWVTCDLPDSSKKLFELLKPLDVKFNEFSC